MKQCVKYPDDKFLAVRPCLMAICLGNRPAGKLLGALLYRYNLRIENKEDAENHNAIKIGKGEQPNQDTSFRIFRTQSQLVDDMCGDASEKTLHDTAIPMLQLLGYLDIEEYMAANCYMVDVNHVQKALDLYDTKQKEQPRLEKFLISSLQLEKFLISSNELEKFLIDKKYFQSRLEEFLIQIRSFSNQNGLKRGRKRAPEAGSAHTSKSPKNNKETLKNNSKNNSNVVVASESENVNVVAPVIATDTPSSQEKEPTTQEQSTQGETVPPVTSNAPSQQVNDVPLFQEEDKPIRTTSKARTSTQQHEQTTKPDEEKKPTQEVSGAPVMPPLDAKWTPEVVVQLTEAKIGKRFQEVSRVVRGKKSKSQRERQLEAAKEVVKSFSREEYTKGYDHRNDDWWNANRGTLTVCEMVANTPRGVMRLIEELENIEKDAARGKPAKPQTTEQPDTTEKKPVIDTNKVFSNGLKYFTPNQFKRPDISAKVGK